MDNAKPSFSAPPYSGGAGAGGKFRKPPISRKRPSTPYDRPSLPTASTQSEDGGGGWLLKLVVNPARRLIVGGATRILPSFFSKSDSLSADGYEDDSSDDEDIDATVNAYSEAKHTLEIGVSSYSGDAGPSNEMDKLKGSSEHNNIQQDKLEKSIGDIGFDKIENMLKGKQLSRDESNRLMEILESRLVDVSNAEGEKKAKADVMDREIPAVLETPRPRLQSNMQDEVVASPIDIARAYMGSRTTSDLGFNTYNNISTIDGREHQHNDLFPPSKPHFLTPSSKSSTCWPGAMVQDQRTPQTQRARYGLHNFPRTPYSRTIYSKTKPKLKQVQGDIRSSNISLTPFQQSQTPNPWQMKTTSEVMDGGYGSVGPIRRVRNKFATEPQSEGPRSISSAQIAAGTSFTSRSFVPVFQKNSGTVGTSNLFTADKHDENFKGEANQANETVRKILEQLDRHKPTPKEKAAELKLATELKISPSQDTSTNLMPNKSINLATGPRSGVLTDYRSSLLKGNDDADPLKSTKAENRTSSAVNDGAAPSFGFRNAGVANEKSTFTHMKGKEKGQPWSLGNQINGHDLNWKRPSQPILKPISFSRPDPQQVISSDNGRGFTFQLSATASSASEPPTPSIMPSFPATTLPQSTKLAAIPTYSFGAKKSSDRDVFSFPSTSSSSDPIDDGESDLKFNFGSAGKKGVSFGSKRSDAIVIN